MTTTSMPSHRNSIPFASWCPLPTKSILSWMSSSSRLCFSRYAGLTSRQLSKLYQYLEAKCCAPCPGHSLTCLGLVPKKTVQRFDMQSPLTRSGHVKQQHDHKLLCLSYPKPSPKQAKAQEISRNTKHIMHIGMVIHTKIGRLVKLLIEIIDLLQV